MAIIQSIIFASAIVLIMLVNEGSAIKCYECNSFNDSRCALDIPPDELSTDCGGHKKGVLLTFCRKIKQTIEFSVNKLPPDSRIIRACGWDDSTYKDKCYQRSGFGGRQEVCACSDKDNCNGSQSLLSSSIIILLTTLLSMFLYFV